jgi:hypothetical protein
MSDNHQTAGTLHVTIIAGHNVETIGETVAAERESFGDRVHLLKIERGAHNRSISPIDICQVIKAKCVQPIGDERRAQVVLSSRSISTLDLVGAVLTLETAHPAELDGVIATVDAPIASARLATGQILLDPPLLDAVAAADRIIVTNTSQLTKPSLAATALALRTHNQLAAIGFPDSQNLATRGLASIEAWRGHLYVGEQSTSGNDNTYVYMARRIDLHGLVDDGWQYLISTLVAMLNGRLIRLQAVFDLTNGSTVTVRGAGQTVTTRVDSTNPSIGSTVSIVFRRADRECVEAFFDSFAASTKVEWR